MICYGEIDYLRKIITIERNPYNISVESKKSSVTIDRIIATWLLKKETRKISIDKEKYKVISVYIPFYSDWVILQNDYLPLQGEYFLN